MIYFSILVRSPLSVASATRRLTLSSLPVQTSNSLARPLVNYFSLKTRAHIGQSLLSSTIRLPPLFTDPPLSTSL